MNELDAFLKDFYGKYSPSDYSPEKVKYIRENYGNDIDALVIDLYDKYADGGGKEKLDYIKSNYNLTGSMLSNNQKNLLDTVADKEAKDYNVIVGGGTFDDYSQHPNVVGMVTAFGPSTAAGKYQITKSTWDKVSEKLGLKDFSPESQDQAALYLAQERFKGKTGKDLDAALESDNPNDIEEIRNVLGGSGSDTLWQGLQGDKDFTRRYNERRGLVDAQGSASNPIGPIGVTFDEGVDQSKFDQETLTNMYIQAGGDPSKEKFTTKISKLGNTSGYNLQFQDSKGTKNYNYLPDNVNVIDKFSSGITNGILKFGRGVSSTIGAVVGLVEDATELVTKGDTNLDKTFDYADNSVMDYLNGIKVYGEETQSYKNVEERARIAAQNQDAIGQIFAQISKLGYSEWWQNSGADMAGSMASFILPGMAVGKLTKGSTIFSRALQSGGVSKGFAENAVGYLVGDSIMSASEAAMEAGTVFKDVKQNLLDKGLSEDEATKQAADAASENWGTNYAGLMATNAIQMGGILGKLSTSTNMAKRVAVGIGAPILSEGFEEAFQTSAQKYSTDKGSNEPYNEGKNTGAFTTMFNPDGALGGTLEGVYKGLMNGDSETWESFIGGAVMGGGSSIIGTSKSVIDYYKTEKPVMSKVNNSLILSPNDIYKTDENNKIIYNKETGKPDIDPTKHLSNIQGVNSILNIDALTQEADNNSEAIKFLHSAKIASIVHDHMSSKNPNIEALDNAINNSMTKKEYEKNKLSNFYSYEEFKDIRKNILETSKNNYNNIYSSPQFKNQSKEFKQGLYHNTVQQDLVGKELDKYTNQLEQLNSKEEKLNSLQKEQKRNLETKIASLNTYKLELEKAFDKHTNNKTKDAKETKAEEIKIEAAEAAKQGVPVEEILANKTGEEFKAAKEGVIEANTQAIIDELDTYNSPKQYEIAIKNNPEHAKLINDHFNTKLAKQTKAPLTNVNQIPTRYGQENNFLQEHEQQKVGQELNNLLNEKENLGEEVANYEQLRTDPNFKFIPDPELVHLGQHILNGGSVATYTQTFNQDNLQDPLLQKAIDKTNNIKEVPVKKESPLPEVINEKEKKTELDLKKEDIEKRRNEELNKLRKSELFKYWKSGDELTTEQNIAENEIHIRYNKELATLETKETEIPFTAPEVFVPMSGLPESRGKNKTVYVTIFDSNGNEVETKVSRFVPKDIWNTSQSSKLEKLNEYFNLSEGYSYKETVIPENEEFNKGTHVASTILKEGDIVYYEVTPNDWNNTATKDNFIISVVSYIKNGKVVKRDIIDAERIVVSQVPSNTNSFIKDNTHKLEIKKIRELAWEKFNNNRSSTFQIAEVKVKNLNRTTAYHKGNWRNITKKEIKNFIFDVVIQKWENNEIGFSSSIKDPALFNSGNSLVGTGNMKIEPQDVGKVIMFVPNTNSVTNEISNIPVKLNTKKLSEVPIFKQKFTDALNDIMKLSTFDERLEATNKMWYNLIGSKVGSISRKRTEDSTFDTDSKDGLVNPRGGIGNIIYYQESKFDPTKKGFFTVINGEEFSYLSVEDLVNKLGETRVHIPHDLVKLTLERFPELVQTDLIEPQERGIESEMPNIFMGTNIMVESLPERIDIVEQEQEQVKQEQEKEQENGIIEEDENIIPVFKISNKSYTGTGAKEYIKERFTEIGVDISDASLDILRELYEVGDKKIWGAFHKAVVHLASDAGLKVGKHEAMHVLFNLFLNPKQKEQIYKELHERFGKELGISEEEFYQKQSLLVRLEEKLADTFEDYKYTGILSDNFKKNYPETSKFLEKIFKFLLDQYHMLKGYLTDSLTINDIFYQLDNNIFGKGYDGKRRKSYQETFSRNLLEIYGEEAKFKLKGVDTINLRKYSKFIVTNIFTNLLPPVKDKSGVPRKVSWLTDVLKDNKDASSLINDLFKKLPAEINRRITNAKTDEIKKSMEEIKSILNEDRFKWEILAQVKEITGYGFTPIEENNNEDVDDDISDEISDPTGEYSESNIVKKDNQQDPKNNIKGKLRELLNKIVKYDLKNNLPLIDPTTGGFVYYEFNEVSNRLYHYLPDSLNEKDMWNRILELSESFEDIWFIRNQIETASKQRNQDIYDTDLFNKLWLKFGGQRKINYSFAINNNDGTVNVKNSTKHRVHDNILTEVRNYIELQNRKVDAPEVNIDNLFQLFNVYGLYISKADIAKLNEKEIVKAINAFTNFEKYISNGGNPFTFELNKTPEIVSANNLVELVVKYSPNLADNVIYTIHGKKEFIVQMNNFLTKTLNQFKNNNKEFRNKFKNTILHSKLPIYDLTETDISKWEVHYNNGFIQQGKKKGTEYSKFTLKELISQNINFAFSDVNSKTMKVMLPIFSDATSHAYINVNKLTPDIIIMQMAKTAIAELERIKFSLNNKTGYENFDKNGKHFLLLPFLEKHKEKLLEFNINDPLLSSHLESLIEPVIKKQFADYTNKLIKLGVLDKIVTVNEAKVKLEKIVAGTGVTSRINESDALDRVREYFYNQYYYNTQFIPLFAGDPAFYKPNKKNKNDTNPEMSVSIDFLKRFKEVHSPTTHGLYKDINGKPKSTKNLLYLYDIYKPSTDEFIDGIAYLNDIPSNIVDTYKKEVRNIYSETKEELTEEEKDLKKKYPNDFSYLHNFSQNNLTDAQKLNNPEFTLMVMEAHDKISPEQRKILREQINNNLATDVTLEVLKPFVFSHEFISLNESSNLLRPFQEKNSEFTLLPNVAYLTKDKTFEIPTKDINWDNYVFPTKAKLLWIMQGKGNLENAIDGISFESATKVDKDTRNLLSIDDVLNMDNDLTSNVVTSSMEGYGLSNEVPADKQIDKNIDLGSQIKVLITEGLKESLTINGITYNPESLLNEFQDLHIKGHREQFKKLKDKTSTAEKTIAILKEAAIKLGKSVSTIMGYNKNVDGKPDIPLELDATSNQHMLNSLTKKTVNESGPGGTFVNVSSVSIDDLAIKWKKDKAGKVVGIDHIECAAAINSPYIDALADKNGIVTVEDVQAAYGEEVTDKLLSMVAYRIPTEDKYSMYPLKIKYILPRSSGAALMLPKEATSITGLDFDVDKMFFIKYAFEIESNFSKYLGHVNDIIGNSSVQDGETISNGLVDPETGNPYVLTTNKFKELFNKALNEDVGLTIEEDAIIEHFKDNMNEYKELLDTKNIKVIPSSYDTSSSRHNFKLDIMLAIAQTTSFARSFTHPGSSSILAREVELFSSPKYSNYDIIEDESTAQVTLPDVQDENAKKANIGGASIGIFANANKHHAIIEYAQLELKKIFNFSNKQYDSIGKRKSEDGKFIKDITASLLFASTEHIKTPLMDKLNIDLDNVNALLAGIRLGIPFHDLMVLINQPVIKDTLKKFPNSTKLVSELNNELSILALQNQIDLNSVQKSDITIAELETMFNPKGLSNKVITRESLIALNKFIELATIGEELFQIQINTKFDTSNQFGPELLDNQFKLQRLEYLYDKLSINSVFKNFDDIVPRVTYNKANQEWTLAPSKLRLNDSYIQIMVDQLNHFKNNFSFLSDSFIKLQYLIKDLSNQDHFYPYQIKKINGEIYNAVAQGTLNDIADIITNIPTEWATIRYKTKEQYMPFLNALTREIVFGKPVLRLYDNVIVGNALSDKYKDIFEDMLADPDTKVFAERLAVYAYFTSGFKFTPRGFSRFVPNTFLLENEQGKKIRDLYNNFDINKSNLNSDEIAELIIYNNPSLVTSINIKEHVDNVVIKPTSHGQLPSSFIIKEDNESLYVDKFGNPNRFLSYTVYIAVGGESVPLEMLFESTGNIRGYYSAVNLPGNSKIFSNYTGVDLGFYPDIAPITIELNSNEISEETQTTPVKEINNLPDIDIDIKNEKCK